MGICSDLSSTSWIECPGRGGQREEGGGDCDGSIFMVIWDGKKDG